jgi:hypothetical protein
MGMDNGQGSLRRWVTLPPTGPQGAGAAGATGSTGAQGATGSDISFPDLSGKIYTNDLSMNGNKTFLSYTGLSKIYERITSLSSGTGINQIDISAANIRLDYNTIANTVIYANISSNISGTGANLRVSLINVPYSSSLIANGEFCSLSFTLILIVPVNRTASFANSIMVSTTNNPAGSATPLNFPGGASSTSIAIPANSGLNNRFVIQQFNMVFPGSSTPFVFTNVVWSYNA